MLPKTSTPLHAAETTRPRHFSGLPMPDYRTLDYVRCRQFLDSRSTADEQVRNIKMFVDNWASLVLASDTPNYADHKRATDRLAALASRAAAERLTLIG